MDDTKKENDEVEGPGDKTVRYTCSKSHTTESDLDEVDITQKKGSTMTEYLDVYGQSQRQAR